MAVKDHGAKFFSLRKSYPWFKYESYHYSFTNQTIKLTFRFNLSDRYFFHPTLEIPLENHLKDRLTEFQGLDSLVFHIGMIELISYWKTACPVKVIVEPFGLTPEQVFWWKKLYFHGLGEFFYLNGIQTTVDDFMQIISGSGKLPICDAQINPNVLVPVGGGKDSAVTLELIRNSTYRVTPFIINPRQATLETCQVAGFTGNEILTVKRNLDPLLLQLNKEGFLNGHTPFSALLAFISLATAALNGYRYIALSNESSANEPTVPESEVNHQYSKSYEFESDFREYVKSYIHPEIQYFSFLRPVNELQIAAMFSKMPEYFPVFKSCNAGSKDDIWCCKCPKCLFTYIILSAFIKESEMTGIFGSNLLDDRELIPLLDELTGIKPVKPFECVGTVLDVTAALKLASQQYQGKQKPALLAYYHNTQQGREFPDHGLVSGLMNAFADENFLEKPFKVLLKNAIDL